MAKLKTQMTGRKNISYKTKYLELKSKYEKLLENKLEIQTPTASLVGDDKGSEIKKEAEAEQPAEALEIKEEPKKEEVVEEEKEVEPVVETPAEKPVEAPQEEKNLEIVEEPEKANPDDYEFSCSKCKELFNKEGNYNPETKTIKCPDCGLEVAE